MSEILKYFGFEHVPNTLQYESSTQIQISAWVKLYKYKTFLTINFVSQHNVSVFQSNNHFTHASLRVIFVFIHNTYTIFLNNLYCFSNNLYVQEDDFSFYKSLFYFLPLTIFAMSLEFLPPTIFVMQCFRI
jgi:hypothetical protein